ncbi:MAG: glycosyltransferase family 39 protein [Myxococcota bacterium]
MSRRLLLALELVLLVLAGWQAWEVVAAMAARWRAPFDLEWMEGATLITGLRASRGLPFYTPPGPDYIPFIYPPLYAWTLGGLATFFPVDYPLGRGVSIVCTGLAAAAAYAAARQEKARPALAIACAALFLTAWDDGGTFYDLVRIDMLSLALCAWAVVLARGDRPWRAVAGGLLLAVAFAAKHHAALLGVPIAIALWARHGWRRAALFAASSAGPALAFTVAMQIATDGLFVTYLLGVPSAHGIVAERALPTLKNGRLVGAQAELWRALPWSTTAGLLFLLAWPRRLYWGGLAITLLLTVSLMRGHHGGYLNVLIPALWLQALFPAFVRSALADATVGWRVLLRRVAPHLAVVLAGVELVAADTDYAKFRPRPGDAAAHARFVDELRALPEPLLVPHAPWAAVQAGKAPSLALIALWDVNHEGGPLVGSVRRIEDAVRDRHWAAVVTTSEAFGYGLTKHYERVASLVNANIPTRTGWNVRLKSVWKPRSGEPAPASDEEPRRRKKRDRAPR